MERIRIGYGNDTERNHYGYGTQGFCVTTLATVTYDLTTTGGRIRWAIDQAMLDGPTGLARELGKEGQSGRVVVSRWVNGKRDPSDDDLRDIARVTSVPFEWLRVGGQIPDLTVGGMPLEMKSARAASPSSRFWAEVDRINALDLPEWQKTIRIDALAAAYRAAVSEVELQARLEAERAALERAAALRMGVAEVLPTPPGEDASVTTDEELAAEKAAERAQKTRAPAVAEKKGRKQKPA